MDLIDSAQKIFRGRESILTKLEPLILSCPKWIRGEHEATELIDRVTDLKLTCNRARISWRRDLLDMYSISPIIANDSKNSREPG